VDIANEFYRIIMFITAFTTICTLEIILCQLKPLKNSENFIVQKPYTIFGHCPSSQDKTAQCFGDLNLLHLQVKREKVETHPGGPRQNHVSISGHKTFDISKVLVMTDLHFLFW
jgi:hypothetical protein